jgi:hypothetical protein
MNIIKLLDKPKVISVCSDVNTGKSMFLYNLLNDLKGYSFSLYTYGLRLEVDNSTQIFSVAELETITNSIIVVDELSSLFDLDNRKIKAKIENTLRLINHNNNILVLCGVPENFKKFISGKIDIFIYKKTTLADLINGCRVKNVLMAYKGYEMGSEVLNLPINRALLYDGKHYNTFEVKYLPEYDSKADNKQILTEKRSDSCPLKCANNVNNFVVHKNVDLEKKGFITVVN